MSGLFAVVKLTFFVILINVISILCVVLWGFKLVDIIPTITTGVFSAILLFVSFASQRIHSEWFKNILAFCVMLGGASAFFWFFQIIYYVGFYINNILVAMEASCSCAMAFLASVYLVIASYKAYLYLLLETAEKSLLDETSPLIVTELAKNYIRYKEKNRKDLSASTRYRPFYFIVFYIHSYKGALSKISKKPRCSYNKENIAPLTSGNEDYNSDCQTVLQWVHKEKHLPEMSCNAEQHC
ncbi:hypothetical protein RN001_013902 [Aquatica leii]|uniref:Uncharacterized protein n=1 Tax=Aquatica leii TaxID=1421715 RepID=A0AAN7P0P5_9COLE|nr:hypothetical protein RN001_013902 [Aquatica leii]